MNSGKAFLGILAGIAAGAVLGIIFAPGKGSSSRKNISKKGEALANALNEKIDEKFDELIKTVAVRVKKAAAHSESGESTKNEMAD